MVGRLLERAGPDDLVLIVGDHGESLDEHGYFFTHGRLPFAPEVFAEGRHGRAGHAAADELEVLPVGQRRGVGAQVGSGGAAGQDWRRGSVAAPGGAVAQRAGAPEQRAADLRGGVIQRVGLGPLLG